MNKSILFAAALCVFVGSVSQAQAGMILHTSRASWESAIAALGGVVDSTVDFNSFSVDASFQTTAVDVGPFTLQQIAGDAAYNRIDAPTIDPRLDVNGTSLALIAAYGGRRVQIAFDGPVLGFGGDVQTLDDRSFGVLLTTSLGETVHFNYALGGKTFLGVTVDSAASAFSSAVMSTGGGSTQTFGFDDVSTSFANVPEPTALALWCLGLVSMSFVRRRRS